MLGRLSELSIQTNDILESWNFYTRLGFTTASSMDVWPYRYTVVTDGRLSLGLHETKLSGIALNYVLPDINQHIHSFKKAGILFETEQLDDQHFNELLFRSPDGTCIRLIEAPTYSQLIPETISLLGWFEQLLIASRNIKDATSFWETLNFVAMLEETLPVSHVPLISDAISMGLHTARGWARETILFRVQDLNHVRDQLLSRDILMNNSLPPGLDPAHHVMLLAPEGTQLLLSSMSD